MKRHVALACLLLQCAQQPGNGVALQPRLFSSATTPIQPASWRASAWCIDPANRSGCASNSNNGTSCACDGAGGGPLMSHAELAVHRWGTYTPTLPAQVTETFLSAQSAPWTDN